MQTEVSVPRHRWIWPTAVIAITLLALGLRWYFVSTARVINPIRADAMQYYNFAWNLAHHGVFSGSSPGSTTVIPGNYRDPGYPLLLAIWMKVFGNRELWYAAVLLTQALLSALTVPLAMLLGRRWLNWRWTAAAGVLMAVWPHNIAIASDLLSETLLGFLCVLAMLLCARASARRSPSWATAAGLGFGSAALTNAILLPFGVLVALFLAWRRLAPRRVWLTLCISAVLLPGAWALRNMHLPPDPSGQTSADRALQNFVQGSWPGYHTAYAELSRGDQRGAPVFRAIDAEFQLLRHSPTTGARAIAKRLSAHPLYYLMWYTVEKPWALWDWDIRVGQNDIYVYAVKDSPFDTQPAMRAAEAICHTINPLLALLALGSLVFAVATWRRRNNASLHGQAAFESVLLLLIYVTVVYSILQTDPRYSIPFRPFEMLLVVTSCSVLSRWVAKLRNDQAERSSAPAAELRSRPG
ncbi:MAG TPA: glycosyltransferase family 39 protein [Rhodanobacteraceae bacterium]|nr:glycosyltransferase family 39 protein [Rhodanobacteraceae bacterium]